MLFGAQDGNAVPPVNQPSVVGPTFTNPANPLVQPLAVDPIAHQLSPQPSRPAFVQPANPAVQPTQPTMQCPPVEHPRLVQPVQAMPTQPIQWYSEQPVQPGVVRPPLPQPTQAPRRARPSPYSRPSRQPSYIPKQPMPLQPGHHEGTSDSTGQKRKRISLEPQPNSGAGAAHIQTVPHANVLTQVSALGAGSVTGEAVTNTNAMLADATRQLAQPRDAPGRSQHENAGPDYDMEDGEDVADELSEALQGESDEILRLVYEGDDAPDQGRDTRLYRLVTRMLQKQDAIYQALENMKQSRRASEHASGPVPSAGLPPRVSPPQPREPVNWDQSARSTRPAGRQPRVARRILISVIIRENINKLLGRKNGKEPLPPSPPPEIRYPTAENFGVRWSEMEKSIFNRMAASVVVERICGNWRADPLTTSELEHLPRMASEHIRYLCRTWKATQKEDAEALKRAALKSASAASRRSTLYECRLRIIDRFPEALNMHRNLIIQLGRAGTSSDEEDPARKGVYLIKRRPELSSKVHILKSKLDLAYGLYCKGPGTRGSQVHIREPSDLVSKRAMHVEGLPITCLSRAWLHTLSKPEREIYGFSGHKYDYSFPDELLRRNFGRDPHAMAISDDEVE